MYLVCHFFVLTTSLTSPVTYSWTDAQLLSWFSDVLNWLQLDVKQRTSEKGRRKLKEDGLDSLRIIPAMVKLTYRFHDAIDLLRNMTDDIKIWGEQKSGTQDVATASVLPQFVVFYD